MKTAHPLQATLSWRLFLSHCVVFLLLVVQGHFAPAFSQSPRAKAVAATPPMGWNSWDAYGRTLDEKSIKASAEWMAQHLKRYGWEYVVVDEG